MTQDEALKLALEALKKGDYALVNAICEELKQAQPKQEPVAWRFRSGTWFNREAHWRYINTLEGTEGLRGLEPLYTAPTQPEQEHFALKHRIAELEGAVIGLQAQLAQPEQEPVGWFGYDQGTSIWFETNKGEDNSVPLYTTPPKQEPVRIMGFNCKCGRRMEVSAEQGVVPAPQRTWQGLTDEEIWQIATDSTIGGDLHADKFEKAIETKLKERNG